MFVVRFVRASSPPCPPLLRLPHLSQSKKARFAVFKILSGSKIYVDCVGTRQNTWKDFKKLCKRQPFFAVYDYEYKTKDGTYILLVLRCYLLVWFPPSSPRLRKNALFRASSHDAHPHVAGRATDKFFCIYYKPQETNQQDCVIYSQKLNSFRTSLSGADNKVMGRFSPSCVLDLRRRKFLEVTCRCHKLVCFTCRISRMQMRSRSFSRRKLLILTA